MNAPHERRQTSVLSEDQIDEIAERAAAKAIAHMQNTLYCVIGKSVLEKLFYVLGIVAVGWAIWLHDRGFLRWP